MKRGQGSESSGAALISDEEYENWKPLVSVLYDWFTHHHLFWPCLSCRWGPQIEQGTYKNFQRLYLSDQTESNCPNSLIIANCEVVRPRVAAAEDISVFNEQSSSPFVKNYKTLIHPGEVNRIRELPQKMNIVATHTDSPDVFIWNLDTQPNRNYVLGAAASRPDVILTGHTENAQFALAMCHTEPFVLSGGHDKSVILWNIEDCITSLVSKKSGNKSSLRLMPRGVFAGHGATVEDVQFCPSSVQEFCSVGDDSCLILWDARSGNAPVIKVEKAHNAEIICVDWNVHDDKLILTGSSDHTVRMFDRRMLTVGGVVSPIHKFEDHKSPVTSIQWCPHSSSVFATGAEDGILNIWDHDQAWNYNKNVRAERKSAAPGLFFKHVGHRGPIADFHWNPKEPWTIASVSTEEVTPTRDGSTLQIWRMTDLLYRPEEDVIADLDKFKEHLETSGSPVKFKKSKSAVDSQPVKSKKSKSPVASQRVESKKSKSPVASQPVKSKRSKSPVVSLPVEYSTPLANLRVKSEKSKSPVASQPVESKQSKSPVANQPVKSKKLKSPVTSSPVESKQSKYPVASPRVESKKSKSPVASPRVESKKSKSPVAGQPVKSKKSKSPVASPPVESTLASVRVKSKKSKSTVASPRVESKTAKSSVAIQPAKSKKSKSPVASQLVESKKSKSKKSTG